MERTVYYYLFPYEFYRKRKKISWLSIPVKRLQGLRRKYPEIIFEENKMLSKQTYLLYGCPISDIPYQDLTAMLTAWAGGEDKVRKVICITHFEMEMSLLNEKLKAS
jgi:hypothetical protein